MVTFVFTDIQGSTQHLRRLGDDYEAVLRRSADVLVETWSSHGRPAVRMGAYTGLAFPRGGEYVALAVHQAVRVMTAAHGGTTASG